MSHDLLRNRKLAHSSLKSPTLVPKMHSKERVKFHVFSRNGIQLVVIIHRGDYLSNEKFYCLSNGVVTFYVGSHC